MGFEVAMFPTSDLDSLVDLKALEYFSCWLLCPGSFRHRYTRKRQMEIAVKMLQKILTVPISVSSPTSFVAANTIRH